eukprot:TRINITY_DN42060_c0_g1_i1.p1 TRINITY_DN42060_c0_g1~~TRINITY_DN42060_c0_g1_i1.p1  ORF type:complete len:1077 (-),score=293.64 TRINITY_DN42060_c0_g1_i1:131-3361(-)
MGALTEEQLQKELSDFARRLSGEVVADVQKALQKEFVVLRKELSGLGTFRKAGTYVPPPKLQPLQFESVPEEDETTADVLRNEGINDRAAGSCYASFNGSDLDSDVGGIGVRPSQQSRMTTIGGGSTAGRGGFVKNAKVADLSSTAVTGLKKPRATNIIRGSFVEQAKNRQSLGSSGLAKAQALFNRHPSPTNRAEIGGATAAAVFAAKASSSQSDRELNRREGRQSIKDTARRISLGFFGERSELRVPQSKKKNGKPKLDGLSELKDLSGFQRHASPANSMTLSECSASEPKPVEGSLTAIVASSPTTVTAAPSGFMALEHSAPGSPSSDAGGGPPALQSMPSVMSVCAHPSTASSCVRPLTSVGTCAGMNGSAAGVNGAHVSPTNSNCAVLSVAIPCIPAHEGEEADEESVAYVSGISGTGRGPGQSTDEHETSKESESWMASFKVSTAGTGEANDVPDESEEDGDKPIAMNGSSGCLVRKSSWLHDSEGNEEERPKGSTESEVSPEIEDRTEAKPQVSAVLPTIVAPSPEGEPTPLLGTLKEEDEEKEGAETRSQVDGSRDIDGELAARPMRGSLQSTASRARPKLQFNTEKSESSHSQHTEEESFGNREWDSQGSESEPSICRQLVNHLVHSGEFESFIGLLIVVNGVVIGLDANYMVTHNTLESRTELRYVEITLFVLFTLEILLRLFGDQWLFITGVSWRWNLFDSAMIAMQIVAEAMSAWSGMRGEGASFGFMRLLRLLRLVRIMRMVRLLRFMSELQLLTFSIIGSLKSLVYTLCLLFLLIYVFCIFLTQLVADTQAHSDDPTAATELAVYYGSIPKAMLTLFQAILGGIDWAEIMDPVLDHCGLLAGLTFALFMAFTLLAMMNIVTGVFVESSLKNANETREYNLMRLTQQIFCDAASGESDLIISWSAFAAQLENPIMLDFFKIIDIDISEAETVFNLLDVEGAGEIGLDQFLSGVLALRGPCKAIDFSLFVQQEKMAKRKLFTQISIMQNNLKSVSESVHDFADRIEEMLDDKMGGNSVRQSERDSDAGSDDDADADDDESRQERKSNVGNIPAKAKGSAVGFVC